MKKANGDYVYCEEGGKSAADHQKNPVKSFEQRCRLFAVLAERFSKEISIDPYEDIGDGNLPLLALGFFVLSISPREIFAGLLA